MELSEYLEIHGSKMGYLERIFLKNVYFEDYGELGLELITPEVEIPRNDGTDRVFRIDFVITTNNQKYAVECDGYNYHAPGMVSRERFNELEIKRNETARQGYTLISLTRDQIEVHPDEAIYQFRRSINSDPELSDIFLKRNLGRISPHEVQQRALTALKATRDTGNDKGLVVLATGLGKTYTAIFDLISCNAQKVLFVVHVDHILKQAYNSFVKIMPDKELLMGFYTGKTKTHRNKDIVFATIQSLSRNDNFQEFDHDFFDYIIIDESHHVAAPSYRKIVDYFRPKFLLGLTATPERMDQKSVLDFYGNNKVFEMNQSTAIKQGFLANLTYLGFRDNVDYSNIYFNGFRYDAEDLNRLLIIDRRDEAIYEKFLEIARDLKTIGFCASIEHAESMARFFQGKGVNAIALHSKVKSQGSTTSGSTAPSDIITAFIQDDYQVVFVVDMFNEGIDIPDVECLLMLRPTESMTILTQQIGRGLRLSPGKRRLLVLDFIGNYRSANSIIPALGLNGIGELVRDTVKGTYHYDNAGVEVIFDPEVVDIFREMESRSSQQVNLEVIPEEWLEFSEYIEAITKPGENLYWSVGKKNNNITTQLWAIDFALANAQQFSTNAELDLALRNSWSEEHPTMPSIEGIRALFYSKLIGLVEDTHPFRVSPAYQLIKSLFDADKSDESWELISSQIEKFYFFNDISGLVNRWHESGARRKVDELFGIYPIFFLYQVLISLRDSGYENSGLSKFEFENFVCTVGNHDDLPQVVDRIISYRLLEEKFEVEKLINQKSSMDSRVFKTLQYVTKLKINSNSIMLNPERIIETEQLIGDFEKLIHEERLVRFTPGENDYRKLLYSDKSLIQFHEGLN